ncbi:HD domain-containing protein [Parasedimentitalea maritima]|uniref:HD domain-containing protein n=1 Tax=Parasedimentitalea maritima TaxID=2578117 RepID=A0ABY2V232_9RHOB|nr:HD domain-containing protein [Zongyanglinia marina]TLP67757.1 HD domain-containing protein [Zongyanglinia marina]
MTYHFGAKAWAQTTNGIMRRRDRITMLRQLAGTQLGEIARKFRLNKGPAAVDIDLSDIMVPDSATSKAAEDKVSEVLDRSLNLHSHRTYYWGMILARSKGLRPDPELLYVSALLHDLGLAETELPKAKSCCFAVNGARLADLFLQEQNWDVSRRTSVFDAISLHLNLDIPASRFGAEAHLLSLGAHLDVTGRNLHLLSRTTVHSVLSQFPRENFTADIVETISAEHHPHSRASLLGNLGFKKLALANPLDK